MKTRSRYKTARRWLLFWTLFVGVGAVAGATGMLVDPSGKAMGMDAMLPYFRVLPFADVLFRDFTFSGIALLIVNGLSNLTAAGLILAKKPTGVVLGGVFGVTLMLWICIQFYIFPLNFMSTAYFIFGLIQTITGYAAWVFARQEDFAAQQVAYHHVGENPRRLVVYFSRMGYAKRLAMQAAEHTGAQVYEVKSTECTAGTLGFWWCGRYGMHRWPMPIAPIAVDLSAYEHVTVCSPIWVFGLAAPMRVFCMAAKGKIHQADYILVHHNRSDYRSAADEMDRLLGIKRMGLRSVCCREGRYLSERRIEDSKKSNCTIMH